MVHLGRKTLLIVLLGLRTVNYKEFAVSFAELVNRENLRLPSGSVLNIKSGFNTTEFLRLLKNAVRKLKPLPPVNHAKNVVDVPRDLNTYTHVLIRIDTSRRSL